MKTKNIIIACVDYTTDDVELRGADVGDVVSVRVIAFDIDGDEDYPAHQIHEVYTQALEGFDDGDAENGPKFTTGTGMWKHEYTEMGGDPGWLSFESALESVMAYRDHARNAPQ